MAVVTSSGPAISLRTFFSAYITSSRPAHSYFYSFLVSDCLQVAGPWCFFCTPHPSWWCISTLFKSGVPWSPSSTRQQDFCWRYSGRMSVSSRNHGGQDFDNGFVNPGKDWRAQIQGCAYSGVGWISWRVRALQKTRIRRQVRSFWITKTESSGFVNTFHSVVAKIMPRPSERALRGLPHISAPFPSLPGLASAR